VLEVVQAMEAASGRSIPYAITERRPGDATISVADPTKRLLKSEEKQSSWSWSIRDLFPRHQSG